MGRDMDSDSIVITGVVDSAEIIEDAHIVKCSCGFELQVSGDIMLNGSTITVPAGHDFTTCPKCGRTINLGGTNA